MARERRFDRKQVLVTGAASGIGRATALSFARGGAGLFLCDVDDAGLAETATAARESGGVVRTFHTDVAKREDVATLAAAVHADVPALDVLVNNAGVALAAPLADTSLDDWDWVLGINLMGVVHGCHHFVPKMIERGAGGHVVNVSSVAGYFATELMTAYATTKFAVFGLSEAMRVQLKRHRIGVSTICPGVIRTPITERMRMRGSHSSDGDRRKIVDFYRRRNYGPERVASAILEAVARNRGVVPVSPEAWLVWYLKRFAPWLAPTVARAVEAQSLRR